MCTSKLSEIRKQLPHGAVKEIATRTKLSTTTVCHILKGCNNGPNYYTVLKAAAEFLLEHKEKERIAMEALEKAVSFL